MIFLVSVITSSNHKKKLRKNDTILIHVSFPLSSPSIVENLRNIEKFMDTLSLSNQSEEDQQKLKTLQKDLHQQRY